MIANTIFAFIALVVSEGEGGGGGLLSVNVGLAVWTTLTFILLVFLLAKFAWKPILSSLKQREDAIKDSLEQAEKAKEEAKQILAENQNSLAKAEDEAQKIIAQGREYAESLKSQIVEESKNEAKKMIENASLEIERKNAEAFNTLKDEVASIAVQAAEKILRANLDKDKQEKIVSEFIKDLSKN